MTRFLKYSFIAGLFTFFFASPSISFSQEKDSTLHLYLSGGGTIAIGKDISEVYTLGSKLSTTLSIPIFKAKLRVLPHVSMTYFGNYINESARDNLTYFTIGSQIERNKISLRKASLNLSAGAFYISGTDYVTPRRGYKGDITRLVEYNGFGTNLGVRLKMRSKMFLFAECNLVSPKVRVSDEVLAEIKDSMNAHSSIYKLVYNNGKKMSFNSLTVGVGYNFIKK